MHKMMDRARFLSRFLRSILLVLFAIILSGCICIPGKGGTRHYVIVGFGIVSVNESEDAITATQTQALGVSISDRPGLKLGIGYASSTVVTVAPGAEDVRVEISKRPGAPLIVDTQSAKFKQSGVKGDGHGPKAD
jgi:hypothetical protein